MWAVWFTLAFLFICVLYLAYHAEVLIKQVNDLKDRVDDLEGKR